MKQEDKDLLLQDLCTRLPYGVKVSYIVDDYEHDVVSIHTQLKNAVRINGKRPGSKYDKGPEIVELWTDVKCIKPYLFPLSSMTEEQLYNNPIGFSQMLTIKADRDWENITINRRAYYKLVDWLNKNHFDYRNLIEKGLAVDCTNLNIY